MTTASPPQQQKYHGPHHQQLQASFYNAMTEDVDPSKRRRGDRRHHHHRRRRLSASPSPSPPPKAAGGQKCFPFPHRTTIMDVSSPTNTSHTAASSSVLLTPSYPESTTSSVSTATSMSSPSDERRNLIVRGRDDEKENNNNHSTSPRRKSTQELLTFPKPIHRSPEEHIRRRRRPVYEGEMEPEGMRGQEAKPPLSPPKKPKKPTQEATTPPSMISNPSLLQFPKPTDRRRRGLYEGEMEPTPEKQLPPKPTISPPTSSSSPPSMAFRVVGVSDTSPNVSNQSSLESARLAGLSLSSSTNNNPLSVDSSTSPLGESLLDVSITSEMLPPNLSTTAPSTSEEVPAPRSDADSRTAVYSAEGTAIRSMIRDLTLSSWPPKTPPKTPTLPPPPKPETPRNRRVVSPPRASHEEEDVSSASTKSSETLKNMMQDIINDIMEVEPPPENALPSYPPDQVIASRSFGAASAAPSSISASSHSTVAVPERLDQMTSAAHSHVEQGEFDLALVLFGKILSLSRQHYSDCHARVASAHHNLGMVHSMRASLLIDGTLQQLHVRQQSLECFQAAARTARDSLGRNHPNVAVSLVKIGFLLLQQGQTRQYQNALVTFQEALRIRLATFGPNHPLVANLYNNLGVCCLHLHKFTESNKHLEQALQLQRHNLRVERQKKDCSRQQLRTRLLEIGDTLTNLGGLGLEWLKQLQNNNDSDDYEQTKHAALAIQQRAERHLGEAMEIRSTVLGHSNPLVFQVKALHDLIQNTTTSPKKKQPHASPRSETRSIKVKKRSNQHQKEAGRNVLSNEHEAAMFFFPPSKRKQKEPPPPPPPPPPAAVSVASSSEQGTESSVDGSDTNDHMTQKAPSPERVPPASTPKDENVTPSPPHITRVVTKSPKASTMPPVTEVVLDPDMAIFDRLEEDSFGTSTIFSFSGLEDRSRGRPRSKEPSKVYMAHQSIPRQSPSRVQEGEQKKELIQFDPEESCLLDDSMEGNGAVHDIKSPDNENALSPHEIMVVRPSVSNGLGNVVPYDHNSSFIAGVSEKDVKQHGGVDESDDGIAPLMGKYAENSRGTLEMHNTGTLCLKANRPREAARFFKTALEQLREIHGELHRDVGATLHNLGLAFLRSDQLDDALLCFERAGRVRKGALGRDHPDVAVSMVKVGITFLMKQQFDSALRAFHDALTVRKRALGALHPSTARVYNNIGCVHVEFHEARDARRAFEAALDIQRNALTHQPDNGTWVFGAATTLCNLGYLYRSRDMHEKAAVVLREALVLLQEVLEPTHSTVLSTMDSVADTLSLGGQCVEALRLYKELLIRFNLGVHQSAGGSGNSIASSNGRHRAEAVLLYKMSRIHRQQRDVEAELAKLQLSLRAARAMNTGIHRTTLERTILQGIRAAREELSREKLNWI